MIYELAVVGRGDVGDDFVNNINAMVKEVVETLGKGKVLLQDNWGKMYLAQQLASGEKKGHFLYFMFQSNGQDNVELARRLGLNEQVARHLTLVIGEDQAQETLLKNFRSPFSKTHKGTWVEDTDDMPTDDEMDKDRRKFSKRKSCWFTAKKIRADWKDPNTYAWLINEFGKISPARVSGVSRKHHRYADACIKRARQLGLASYISGRIADPV